MGEAVARETVEQWYQTRTFVFQRYQVQRLLRNFLKYDLLLTAIKPRTVIRQIRFLLPFGQRSPTLALTSIRDQLPYLHKIKNNDVKITFVLYTYTHVTNEKAGVFLRSNLEIMGPIVYRFLDAGFRKVDVQIKESDLGLNRLWDVPECDFAKNLVSYICAFVLVY
jgi:hypothetical protein